MGCINALVVDDEADLRDYISAILEEKGISVRAAGSAEEAEVLLRESRPDLILLDLVMPGRGGIQFFVKLRGAEDTKDIPLILVTGIRDQKNIDWKDIVERYRTRAPDGFIEKPIDPEELSYAVDEVLSRSDA